MRTPARSAAPHYIDPHLEFIPTTHEHLHAMCERNDYSTTTDAITPAHLLHLDIMDLRRIFWLIELQGDLRELCRVDRTMTYNELLTWASTPHIAAMLMTPRLHPDCYLPPLQPPPNNPLQNNPLQKKLRIAETNKLTSK